MTRYLLDVNVLLALLWPRHESHGAAHAWFSKQGQRAWATCPLTQLGALRLLTNPAVTHGAVGATTALEVVAEATRQDGHQFWPLERDVAAGLMPIASSLQGNRQWTDTVLLGQAIERKGVLVTLDAGVKMLAGREFADHVLWLKRG